MNCPESGCTGDIGPDGYCTVCGVKTSTLADPSSATTVVPKVPSVDSGEPKSSGASGTKRSRATGRKGSSPRNRLGGGFIDVPPIAEHDPATAVIEDLVIPENKRTCSVDGEPVGRSHDGVPGRTEGFCPKCGHPFSFKPKLAPHDVVGAARYEIVGCLAHGGLGWIYLARDRQLEHRWVVLKGLLNTGDPDALAAALAERRFLAEVDHNDVVDIYDFVEHGSDGYIVMEYVKGKSLRGVLDDHRAANDGAPLPVAHAIAYVHEILPALGYLHRRGLLFCDFKPDNVMQTGASLKLIDLGGVYRIGDNSSVLYGTPGYQPPEFSDDAVTPTPPSDLFTVGRTLAVLSTNFRGFQSTYEYTLPPQSEVPLYERYDSLYRFLQRATALNPEDRFQTADEMADQLFGIMREVAAYETGVPAPAASTIFTSELSGDSDRPDWRTLPALLVSADDPASGYLASVGTTADDANALVTALEQSPVESLEVDLSRARALIEAGRAEEAATVLDEIAAENEWEWRVDWYRGLMRMSTDEPEAALEEFEFVYRALPGELATKLARGCAAESYGQMELAAHCYDIVSRTDRTFTSAAFGLARCRLALGDHDGSVAAYDRVPNTSNAHEHAQIAKAQGLLHPDQAVAIGDVVAAGAIVGRLPLNSEARAWLTAEVLDAALPLVKSQSGSAYGATVVLGCPLTEEGVRRGLEDIYRALAHRSAPGQKRIELVDRANRVRPRSLV